MITLYHGQNAGAPPSPNPVQLDRLLGARMRASGFSCDRTRKSCLFASTDRLQAFSYASDPDRFFRVIPADTARLTWIPGVADAMLDFETWIKSRLWNDEMVFAGRNLSRLLLDSQGDIDILNTYLQLGRQKKAISLIVDAFLLEFRPRDICFADDPHLEALSAHEGEVVITGSYQLTRELLCKQDCLQNTSDVA